MNVDRELGSLVTMLADISSNVKPQKKIRLWCDLEHLFTNRYLQKRKLAHAVLLFDNDHNKVHCKHKSKVIKKVIVN